ncbi:MAG: 2-C-methyl-D-erythritol 2,4-cyclodiphosphate synthase [Oscillospiraceae bacterium]|jgi:2-C-methyl-D-erythritol 2,4-cyclodiphosphate synthase|nr:2-C-methyl-D-erythritol 2,4-cyclodiphosphate synthase [Oscillospiraceae bacterium]
MRIGFGYDAHRLVAGRDMILCGVKIPSDFGLLGYSDADVALHALCDALLGSAALGDLGTHFPAGDERYRGIASTTLVRECAAKLAEAGYRLENCDITIVLQAPRLAPYIQAMREATADALGTDVSRVSVKATTEERMGFTGSGEGAAAYAVVLAERI